MDIKYNTDTKIEDNARLYQLQKANFDQEVNTAVSFSRNTRANYISHKVTHKVTLTYPLHFDSSESRGSVSLRASSGKDKTADTKRGDTDRSCGEA